MSVFSTSVNQRSSRRTAGRQRCPHLESLEGRALLSTSDGAIGGPMGLAHQSEALREIGHRVEMVGATASTADPSHAPAIGQVDPADAGVECRRGPRRPRAGVAYHVFILDRAGMNLDVKASLKFQGMTIDAKQSRILKGQKVLFAFNPQPRQTPAFISIRIQGLANHRLASPPPLEISLDKPPNKDTYDGQQYTVSIEFNLFHVSPPPWTT